MKKLKNLIIILLIFFLLTISWNFYTERSVAFNKITWNDWDITYPEIRYNMAKWFFEVNWFYGMTKDAILEELYNGKGINHIIHFYGDINNENILLFDLKYSNEFMERNIDFDFKPIAYLRIFFDEENNITRAELLEGTRKYNVRNYNVKLHWDIYTKSIIR